MTTKRFVASHAIRHRELGRCDDIEMLEVVLPAGLTTEEVSSVNG